ncbi:tRNA dimethylallyltransferase, mitochondrial [Plakobranchus ocellatus]|uniref:tRNA dimethylallyltransferase, mitochondrial n=1 Tax=Plakobranchus ocellatus TaxID=259542 RepID=A0AAV4DV81_9GAST|nr:tRNA dimethylallyltransferase, mitochondrial [Plakobranchus ocellatus]
MLGFKEFSRYLCLSPELRRTEEGKELFNKGVEDLKQATRRYAKQQVRWITNRFCARPGPNVPPVYSVDSTDLGTWDQAVAQAIQVVKAFTQGLCPSLCPEPTQRKVDSTVVRQVCHACGGRVFLHQHEWTGHLKSKKHKHNVKLAREREKLSATLEARETQLRDRGDQETGADTTAPQRKQLQLCKS